MAWRLLINALRPLYQMPARGWVLDHGMTWAQTALQEERRDWMVGWR